MVLCQEGQIVEHGPYMNNGKRGCNGGKNLKSIYLVHPPHTLPWSTRGQQYKIHNIIVNQVGVGYFGLVVVHHLLHLWNPFLDEIRNSKWAP